MIRLNGPYNLKRKPNDMYRNNIPQSFVPPVGFAKYSVYFTEHRIYSSPVPGISVRYFITLYCSYGDWKIFRYLHTYIDFISRAALSVSFLPSSSLSLHLRHVLLAFLSTCFFSDVMQSNKRARFVKSRFYQNVYTELRYTKL